MLAVLCALAVALVLARRTSDGVRLPAWRIACWAWCPLTAVELGNNAHIDGLAVLFSIGALSVGALTVGGRGRPGWAGVLLGAAVATKLYPGLLVLVLLRHRGFRLLAAASAVVALGYLPHVLAVGVDVVGYLPGYLREENYTSGGRFEVLSLLVPHSALTPVAVLALACLGVCAVLRSDPLHPERAAVWLVGIGLLITTPAQTWYVLLLVALVAMTGQLRWLPVCLAPTVAELAGLHFSDAARYASASYRVAVLAVLASWLLPRVLSRLPRRPQRAAVSG